MVADAVSGLPWDESAVRSLAEVLSRRWVLDVLAELWTEGPVRRARLRARLDGISDRVLTDVLRDLERRGLISRRLEVGVPVHADYELTDRARNLEAPLQAISAWAIGEGVSPSG